MIRPPVDITGYFTLCEKLGLQGFTKREKFSAGTLGAIPRVLVRFAGRAGVVATYMRNSALTLRFAGRPDRCGPDEADPFAPRSLYRTVTVSGRRTTLILDRAFWNGLGEICAREDMTLNELCTEIDGRRGAAPLTSSVRVFVLSYFRSATPAVRIAVRMEDRVEARPPLNSALAAVG